jgi:hypothetical protein
VVKLHMEVAMDMFDHQKPTGGVYDQGGEKQYDFKKMKKTHFKMRVGTNGLTWVESGISRKVLLSHGTADIFLYL